MDIVKLAEYDPRVVQKRPAYAVDKGALSITNSPFPAIGLSTSQLTFNVQSPSLSVFLDRKVDLTAQVRFQFTATCKTAPSGLPAPGTGSTPVLVIGRDIALCAHPIHSLVSTMTATINDAVVSTNTADVLYEIARLVDESPSKIQRTTPSYLDKYVSYGDAVGAINNPLSSYFDATDYNNLPNGAYFDLKFTLPSGADIPAGTGSYTSGAITVQYVNGTPVLTNTQTVYPLFMSFTATEKLFLSPFIWNEVVGDQVGLFGLNNFQLVLNLQAPTRLIRVAPSGSGGAYAPVSVSNVAYNSGATGGAIGSAKLNCLFLTPPLDINLPSRSVLPYMEFPRYVSTNPGITTALGGGTSQIVSNTITLPVIPDMLIVYVKPGSYTNDQGDYYLPITQVSVNFDNFSGLLASHTTEQLYHIAVKNGLRMDYNSWRGIGKVVRLNPAFTTIATLPASVPLVGGFLVLKMGEDIPLQTGLSAGVVGSYSLQMTLTCQNNTTADVVAPQLFIIAVNSGVFETQAGQSRILRGLLTEQDVIQAPPAPESARDELERVVGGGFMSKLGTALSRATSLIKDVASNPAVQAGVRAVAQRSSNPLIREVASALPSGRGVAGGRRTGGRRGADMSALM